MKYKTGLWFLATLLFCLLAATAMWAQSDEQHSLGDIARRKPSAKARRVFTNDEIQPNPQAGNPPSPTISNLKTQNAPAPSGADQVRPNNAKSSEQSAKLQQFTAEHERLRRVIKDLEGKIAATTDPQRKATLSEVLRHAQDSLQENERQTAKLKAAPAAQPASSPSSPSSGPPQ